MSKNKAQLPKNQEQWEALREQVVTAAYGYATAVDEVMPVDYPGPKMVSAFLDYLKRAADLHQGLLDYGDKWGQSD